MARAVVIPPRGLRSRAFAADVGGGRRTSGVLMKRLLQLGDITDVSSTVATSYGQLAAAVAATGRQPRSRMVVCSTSITMSSRPADIAEPKTVFVAHHFANALRATGSRACDGGVDVVDGKCDTADT
jgi:hypothetical protein